MLDFAYFTPIVHIEQKNKLARLLFVVYEGLTHRNKRLFWGALVCVLRVLRG